MLPILKPTAQRSKKYTVAFRGINYGEGYQDGEFSETENVSTALYPCLGQRFARVHEGHYGGATSLHTKGEPVVVDGTGAVWYGDKVVGAVTPGRKQMATVGNYVIIFPDKKYFSVADTEKRIVDMEVSYPATTLTFEAGSITTSGADWPIEFKKGDAVKIEGCANARNNQTPIIRKIEGKKLIFDDNIFTAGTETTATLKREVPDLDYICENNYRLWGVKGNTIYGSKFSDPLNFQSFEGLAGDSYYIDVGSDGPFTGCIPYGSHICFFKENCLHKLYGDKPKNYQIVTSQVYGVQEGSERSMCIINEVLYYKGVLGVYAYTGGVPELVSGKFGQRRFTDACAATDGTRYYICMEEDGKHHLFAYDVLKNLWVREDGLHCVDMAAHDGAVHLLTAEGDLWRIDESGDISDLEWSATFCPFNEVMNERKGYSKFHMRLDLAAGAHLTVEYKRNTDKRWQIACVTHNERAQTLTVPILPARCDSVEIRLRGKGECTLRTFIREFWTGSDR